MAQINVSNLTFHYEGSYDTIFENVSFSIDTDWKLGFIGRNGKGKTTFLNLLLHNYSFEGSIHSPAFFDYFPYLVARDQMELNTLNVLEQLQPDFEFWRLCIELDSLHINSELLYRPFQTLSHGERTKVMLALLFSRDNYFLLIDEPTNHLDSATRDTVRDYLNTKKGFLLVSHDRWLLDACIDHVLVLNRSTIEVQKGTFSSWWENKQKQDQFEQDENNKLIHEIEKLNESARQSSAWADKVERSKIGYDPIKNHDRSIGTRSFIGEKSRRMQQRRKNLERRQEAHIQEKTKLLKNIEKPVDLVLMPLTHHKERYVFFDHFGIQYDDHVIIKDFSMELKRGDRILLEGKNGSGKSSIIKSILSASGIILLNDRMDATAIQNRILMGELQVASGLKISYINQDTSHLAGKLNDYIERSGVEESLFKAVLRQLDFERVQFEKRLEEFSEGQKKKVLIAGSLLQQAHLYIWDEPLNYIDVFSRMQIEQLILSYQPTMLLVEHDKTFEANVATKKITISTDAIC